MIIYIQVRSFSTNRYWSSISIPLVQSLVLINIVWRNSNFSSFQCHWEDSHSSDGWNTSFQSRGCTTDQRESVIGSESNLKNWISVKLWIISDLHTVHTLFESSISGTTESSADSFSARCSVLYIKWGDGWSYQWSGPPTSLFSSLFASLLGMGKKTPIRSFALLYSRRSCFQKSDLKATASYRLSWELACSIFSRRTWRGSMVLTSWK